MNRSTQIIYYLGFLIACSYVLIRGFSVGITHDEALTYKIIQGDEILKGTANHHWLNTQLSSWSTALFGAKEFALRLPNILSFALFWFFLFRISKNFLSTSATQIALLLFLCGNPFILDFFSLCRGYGLSIACVTASLFYVFRIVDLKKNSKAIHYFLGTGFSILALSANLNTLNYFLIAQTLMLLSLLVFKPKKWIFVFTVFIIFSGVTIYFSLDRLFFLKTQDELYFGTGNLNSSIDSLIASSFYAINGFENLHILRYLFYVFLLLAGLLALRKRSVFTPGSFSFIITVGIFSALALENLLFDALYPINRSLLYLYPIFLLTFLLNIEPLKLKVFHGLIIVSSVSFIGVNIPFYNFKKTMTWREDQDIKEAMLLIKGDVEDKSIHIAQCTWIYEPVINYYRLEYDVPIQQLFRDAINYQSEYLIVDDTMINDLIRDSINDQYIVLDASHIQESGLTLYKRKPSGAN
ncbi:glycosyltransferase family 39 protein [Fluviicola chungangensis]|uniref:Glycosyltransferase family 39 protein n=1 Tax=Fluviicola chungangensis TaxID=2597671 RepID=A0A556N0D7_9FLAO|nr:glycosyltransferase family 39 protein [Fluviicola chungangensis]TSJ45543.1 glycosyltransferase family 39 protein [Fluviicola chungangensis]